jgi:hypothetical protein
MQQGRTATWQTDDEERFANFLSHNAWVRLSIPLDEQTRTQSAHEICPKDNSSDQVELGLALTGIQQPRQTLEKVASPKIVETATTLCGVDQINCSNGNARNSTFVQQGATAIEKPHGQDRASLIKSCGGRIHF